MTPAKCDPVGIMIGDVDGLKFVNDTQGHEAGNRLLVAAAQTIRNAFSEDFLMARVGGDEFAIMAVKTERPIFEKARQQIREAVDRYNEGKPGFTVKFIHRICTSTMRRLRRFMRF